MSQLVKNVKQFNHHVKQNVCENRPVYRRGKKERVIKVYTISQESVYLIVTGVPSVGAASELRVKFETFGEVLDLYALDDYPCEEFTDAFIIKYKLLQSARFAKKKLDDVTFLGGVLHIFYAPEFENIQETQNKIRSRLKHVGNVTGRGKNISFNLNNTTNTHVSSVNIPESSQPATYVWAGKTYTYDTNSVSNQTSDSTVGNSSNSQIKRTCDLVPRQVSSKRKKV